MASTQVSKSFCIFCYKSVRSPARLSNDSFKIKTFFQFLTRFVECGKLKMYHHEMLVKNYANGLFKACEECELTIDSFCELYNQFKYLELQLDYKLEKIVETVKLANRIPARFANINKAIQLTCLDDKMTILETSNEVKTIRQNVIKAGHYKISNSLPRVLVTRCGKNSKIDKDESLIDMEIVSENSVKEPIPFAWDITVDPLSCQNETDQLNDNPCITFGKTTNGQQINMPKEYPAIPIIDMDDIFSRSTLVPSSSSSSNVVPRRVTCQICQRQVLKNRGFLHYKLCHDVRQLSTGTQVLKCKQDGCSAYFIKKCQLIEHRKVHVEQASPVNINGVHYFQCKTCKTPFHSFQYLKRHLLNFKSCGLDANGEVDHSNHECLECKLKFERKENLWLHQNQVHSSGKYKVCPKCGKSFNSSWNYKVHMEYHKGPAEWKWECNQCKKRFASVNQLKRHAKSHFKGTKGSEDSTKIKSPEHDNVKGEITGYLKFEQTTSTAEEFTEFSDEEIPNFETQPVDLKPVLDPLQI